MQKQIIAKIAIRNQPLKNRNHFENYPLYEGDNILGSDQKQCSIVLQLPNIDSIHANITISDGIDVGIENLSQNLGITKQASLDPKQQVKLKLNKQYELQHESLFYIGGYLCVLISESPINQKQQQQIDKNSIESTLILEDKQEFEGTLICPTINQENQTGTLILDDIDQNQQQQTTVNQNHYYPTIIVEDIVQDNNNKINQENQINNTILNTIITTQIESTLLISDHEISKTILNTLITDDEHQNPSNNKNNQNQNNQRINKIDSNQNLQNSNIQKKQSTADINYYNNNYNSSLNSSLLQSSNFDEQERIRKQQEIQAKRAERQKKINEQVLGNLEDLFNTNDDNKKNINNQENNAVLNKINQNESNQTMQRTLGQTIFNKPTIKPDLPNNQVIQQQQTNNSNKMQIESESFEQNFEIGKSLKKIRISQDEEDPKQKNIKVQSTMQEEDSLNNDDEDEEEEFQSGKKNQRKKNKKVNKEQNNNLQQKQGKIMKRATENIIQQNNQQQKLQITYSGFKLESQKIIKLSVYGSEFNNENDHTNDFDILIVNKATRTFKMMKAMLLNIPIVNEQWVDCCIKDKQLVNNYKDFIPASQQEFIDSYGGALADFIKRRQQKNYKNVFENYKFFVSKSFVQYNGITHEQLEDLINLGGGQVLTKKPTRTTANQHVVFILDREEEDHEIFKSLCKKTKAKFCEIELILFSSITCELRLEMFEIKSEYFEQDNNIQDDNISADD